MVHRFHAQGGWAQMRYQRHIERQVENHYKDTAEITTRIIDDENWRNVILIGQNQEVKNFREILPKRVNMRVIDINSLYMRENINEIMETIIDDLYNKEKERELAIVNDLFGKTDKSLGIQDTVQLAKDGRVNILAVVKNLAINGFKCDHCFYVSKDQHWPGCPKCNGNMKETDLVEEAIRLTLKNNGKVELVENQAAVELEKHEGIGAYLRY